MHSSRNKTRKARKFHLHDIIINKPYSPHAIRFGGKSVPRGKERRIEKRKRNKKKILNHWPAKEQNKIWHQKHNTSFPCPFPIFIPHLADIPLQRSDSHPVIKRLEPPLSKYPKFKSHSPRLTRQRAKEKKT